MAVFEICLKLSILKNLHFCVVRFPNICIVQKFFQDINQMKHKNQPSIEPNCLGKTQNKTT